MTPSYWPVSLFVLNSLANFVFEKTDDAWKSFFSQNGSAERPPIPADGFQYVVLAIEMSPLLWRWAKAWKTSVPAFFCCGVILAPFWVSLDDATTTAIACVVYIAICCTSDNIICSGVGDALLTVIIYIGTPYFAGIRCSAITAVALRLVQRVNEPKRVEGLNRKLQDWVCYVDKIIDEMYLTLVLTCCSWIFYRWWVDGDFVPVFAFFPVWIWAGASCVLGDLFCDSQKLYNHIFTLIVYCGSSLLFASLPFLNIEYCQTTMSSYTEYLKDFASLTQYKNESDRNLCTKCLLFVYTAFIAMFLFDNISCCMDRYTQPRCKSWAGCFRKVRCAIYRNKALIGWLVFVAFVLHQWNVWNILFGSTKVNSACNPREEGACAAQDHH